MHKVIVIGLQRTGTTSMGQALIYLGYKVVATIPELEKYLSSGQKNKVIEFADQFDAYQDLPWLFLYKELDKRYPNSKFILTKRDEDSWLQSMLNHFGKSNTKMREWAYGAGCPTNNEELYLEAYRKHHQEVEEYFKHRKEDLLTVELGKDQNWDKLCTFLQKEIPNKKFPFENKNPTKLTLTEKSISILRSIVPIPIQIAILKILGIKTRANRFHTEKTDIDLK